MLPAAYFLAHCANRIHFQGVFAHGLRKKVSFFVPVKPWRIKDIMPLDYCWCIFVATQMQTITVQARKQQNLSRQSIYTHMLLAAHFPAHDVNKTDFQVSSLTVYPTRWAFSFRLNRDVSSTWCPLTFACASSQRYRCSRQKTFQLEAPPQ